MKIYLLFILVLLHIGILAANATALANQDFSEWIEDLRTEASAEGISAATLDSALKTLKEPEPRVVELDRNQPEFTQTLANYVEARVSDTRIEKGRRMLRRYPTWLGRVEERYGVQRRFLVALWGIESNYGAHTGGFSVIPALATLAYDDRRAEYFRRELLHALHILDAGHVSLERMKGSWAGAMGQCQFMPSSFRRFAVDADGDGRIDIWNSIPDVLASAANYLSQVGWDDDLTWGRPVLLPDGFDPALTGLDNELLLSRWQSLGVRRSNGRDLPTRSLEASLIAPDGKDGPAYLVYDNFHALLKWNRSNAFAVAVGTLSDRLVR